MSLGFLDHMRAVPDHRIPGMVTYPLDEIFLATLVGVVRGPDDWEGVEEIAKGALDWLCGFLPFASGIPPASSTKAPITCSRLRASDQPARGRDAVLRRLRLDRRLRAPGGD